MKKRIDFNRLSAIFANLAVIVGIAFLGFEIRQNTSAVRATAFQDMANELASYNLNWTRPDLAEIRLKLTTDGYSSLSEIEKQQLYGMDTALLLLFQNFYYQFVTGALDQETWAGRHRTLVTLFRLENIRQRWAAGGGFDAGFRAYIDDIVLPEALAQAPD